MDQHRGDEELKLDEYGSTHFSERRTVSCLLVTLISNPRDVQSLFLSSGHVDDALWSGRFLLTRTTPSTPVNSRGLLSFQLTPGLSS